MSRPRSTAVLVAGMHRSGTSATAGALALAGVSLGGRLLEGGIDNPKGYWENESAVRINEGLLRRLGRRWDDVRPLPDGWTAGDAASDARSAVIELIRDEFGASPLWAVKDPRICRLMPVWLGAVDDAGIDPAVLFVVRSPWEVAASITARNGWATEVGLLLWIRHMVEAELASRTRTRSVITYEALLHRPESTLREASRRLGFELPTLDKRSLSSFVSETDRHHRLSSNGHEGADLGRMATRLYAALQKCASNPRASWGAFKSASEELDEIWAREGGLLEGVAAMAASFAALAEASETARAQTATELRSQLAWSEQAISVREQLQADNARLQSQLTAQLDWSEEAVRVREALYAEQARLKAEVDVLRTRAEELAKTQNALEVDNVRLRSDLTAQIAWSEEAVRVRDGLHAEMAAVRSELNAQLDWAKEAVGRHEELHAENARLQSELTAQIAWSVDAVRAREELHEEKAKLQAELNAQIAWAKEAVRKHEALHADNAKLQSELTAQIAWSVDAVRVRDGLHAEKSRLQSELNAQLAWAEQAVSKQEALQADNARLQADLSAQLAWSKDAERAIGELEAGRIELEAKLNAQVALTDEAINRQSQLEVQVASLASELRVERDAAIASDRAHLAEHATLQLRIADLNESLVESQQALKNVHDSWTWKASRPLRYLTHVLQRAPRLRQ